MEMGTGKSRVAVELASIRRTKIDAVFWFCPVAAKETIRAEILKHTDCPPEDIYVFDQKTSERTVPAVRWYIIGIESMAASARVVCTVNQLVTERSMCIVDEASYIKGHTAKRTQRLTRICERARYRLILTGTPISQGVVDLFAQMRFLSPKILSYRSFYSFAANHLEYHPERRGMIVRSHNVDYLAAKIRPYIYQVAKDECLTLPPKLYEDRYCQLSWEQDRAYEEAKQYYLVEMFVEDQFSSIHIFQLFTALQGIVCGFWTRPDGAFETYQHNRITLMLDTVSNIAESERIIIWAKYRYCVREITEALQAKYGAESTSLFYGDVTEKQRNADLARWRAGDSRFLIATQSAGGVAQNWMEASNVIFYADSFKYAEREQAEDRCHRIGQDKRVTYVSLRSVSGIDDRIYSALINKGSALKAFKAEIDKIKTSRKERLRELVKSL